MRTIALASALFVTQFFGPLQSLASDTISGPTLTGVQIEVMNPDQANRLFEVQKNVDPSKRIVLAGGQVQIREAAVASGVAVICQFSGVTPFENGYMLLAENSILEISEVRESSVPSMGLLQLELKVRHSNFHLGIEHMDRAFSCFNQPGTTFDRASLNEAFGGIFQIKN